MPLLFFYVNMLNDAQCVFFTKDLITYMFSLSQSDHISIIFKHFIALCESHWPKYYLFQLSFILNLRVSCQSFAVV